MDSENINSDRVRTCWSIDLDWYQPHNRSFFSLVWDCLCPGCQQRLGAEERDISATDLLATIKDCCSEAPGFISGRLPVLPSIFRLFLANGNHPLDVEELGTQLNEQRGGDTYRTSVEILSRLLASDHYYGLRPVAG